MKLAVLGIVLTLSACTPVESWQRSTLARRCMQPSTRPEESGARQHMLGARESSQGAAGKTGGGCGCN